MMKGVAMHSYQTPHCRIGLPLAWVLGFVIVVASGPVHAIPMAGNYAFTSGFTGVFTSDGSKLTAWDFKDPSNYHWSDRITVDREPIIVHANDANGFGANVHNRILYNEVNLEYGHTNPFAFRYDFVNNRDDSGIGSGSGMGTFQVNSSVPIPSTFLPFVVGLLILVGYHWRQQRVRRPQTE
jgi:hypothetical protein